MSKAVAVRYKSLYVSLPSTAKEEREMNKITFLKKLWCCIGGKYYKTIWFYQLG